MQWNLPGTVLSFPSEEAVHIEKQFQNMFLGGGIALSQVANITGLEAYAIQNWVKRGFLTPPEHKRYTMHQLCRIININMLKDALAMEEICGLLTYINGQLNDESDDLIDDSALYFMFVKLAARVRELNDPAEQERILDDMLADYQEPVPGARQRVKQVLRIMLTAWIAARMRQEAERMLKALPKGE